MSDTRGSRPRALQTKMPPNNRPYRSSAMSQYAGSETIFCISVGLARGDCWGESGVWSVCLRSARTPRLCARVLSLTPATTPLASCKHRTAVRLEPASCGG